MSIGILFAVLGSAFLHALWNALIKTGTSRLSAMVVLSILEVPTGLIVASFFPFPVAAVWPWVFASGATHFFYKFFLTYAYERGDLSRVYPIARGTAPLIVALTGGFFLSDQLSLHEYLGVALLGGGILLMAQGVFSNGENRKLLPFALGSALATAAYTMIDGSGARVSGQAVGYVAWVFVVDGLTFASVMLAYKGTGLLPREVAPWGRGAIAAAASFGAYGVSVWAMTKAPIAVVAAVRETSILFAVLIGWLAFGEKLTRGKAIAACVIVAGVVLTRL